MRQRCVCNFVVVFATPLQSKPAIPLRTFALKVREALKWLRKAAEQSHAPAEYDLGLLYDQGCGVEQSHAEALQWYRKAAEHGFEKAKTKIGPSS